MRISNTLTVLVWLTFAYSTDGTVIKSGKIFTNQTMPDDHGCAQIPFNSVFKQDNDIRVIVSLGHSDGQHPMYDAAALWVKQVTSRGFKVCVYKSGVKFNETGVINWLALHGTVTELEQGVVDFDSWGGGTQCKTVQPNKLYSKPLHVFATVVAPEQSTAQDAMYVWVTKHPKGGAFAICLREVSTFSGIHSQLSVNWIAFDEIPSLLNFTESKKVFLSDLNMVDYSYCKIVNFTSKFFLPPVVMVTASYHSNDSRPISQNCKAMTSWVEEITTSHFKVCIRELPDIHHHDYTISVDYVVLGDLDPCINISCDYFAVCKAFAPHYARCVCVTDCPTYEEQVCSSNGTTFRNKCYFELEMCRLKSNHTLYHPGSCRGFPLDRGRHFWLSHNVDGTICKRVKFRPCEFYPDKRVHVHLTVNHINTTSLDLVHDATATWVESVNYEGFTACLTTAGRGESARATKASFDWFAYQGAPDGAVTDRTRMNKWWAGATCKTIQLPKDKFQTEPTVIVTTEHISAAFKHDAANIWLEKTNKTAFMVCLRELQNFDGKHEDIHVSWMAFDKIHQPQLFSEKGSVLFSNQHKPSMKYNGAFCKDLKFIKRYNHVPIVILSTNHLQGNDASKPVCNGVSTWIEYMNTTGLRICLKEIYTDKYEPLSVNYLVLSELYCEPLSKPEFGYYLPESCSPTKKVCKSSISTQCVFHCNNGFQIVGQDSDIRRTCQASGKWTYSEAKCKDITPPRITCPGNIEVGNDPGKSFARITLPSATATDNSGTSPSIKISSPNIKTIQDFNISALPIKVTYEAVDNAGLSDTCNFYVQVKDKEKPAVLYCPDDYDFVTNQRPQRVVFKEPIFKDNFDSTPTITSSHTSGQEFSWKTYRLTFNATDKAGNMASCSYNLQVGPMKCKLYDAPVNGIRACNIKFSGVKQEYVCTVQCRDNYDFVTKPQWHSYICKEDGFWYGYKNNNYQKLDGKPWPDCSVKSPPTGVAKKVKVYAGTCLSGNEATQTQIKNSFLQSIKQDLFMNVLLCISSKNADCNVTNVKVYCGRNSRKRGLGTNTYVIDADVEILDLSPSPTESEERRKLKKYSLDIQQKSQELKDSMKRAAAAAVKVQPSTIDVEDDQVTGACASGKVVIVKDGNGSDLDRSECFDCSEGTYYDRDTKLCVPCKKGSYQDKEGQQFCKTCPNDTDTLTIGAKSVKDCEECGMDFERGIDNWTKTGTAFDNQPTYGDNSRHRGKGSAQHQGNWWIGGYENRPKSSMPPGAVQGDGPQGTLTSPLFLVTGKDISFLIGGGCDIDLARVELLIDGEVVRKETGSKCIESMVRRHWDVTEYKGMNAQVRLVDYSSEGWGHINFDDLRGDTCIMFQKHKTTSVK